MYICTKCGEIAVESKTAREYHDDYYYEDIADRECPRCGASHGLQEACECFICGDLVEVAETERDRDNKRICHRCYEDIERPYNERTQRQRRTILNDLIRIDSGIFVPA